MRRRVLLVVLAIMIVVIVGIAYQLITSRSLSPQDTAKLRLGAFDAHVVYCQPYKKGRLIFGNEGEALVPYGKKWRTGANEATILTVNETIYLGGKQLAPGRYSLYTVPEQNLWTLAVNSRVDYWGASFTDDPFKEEFDVLRVSTPTSTLDSTSEQFHIQWTTPTDSTIALQMYWDQTLVSFDVKRK